MPLVGLHVECGYAGGPGLAQQSIPTNNRLIWSQNLTAPGIATLPVPNPDPDLGSAILSIRAANDAFITYGKNIDLVNGPFRYLRQGTSIDVLPDPGDSFGWTSAAQTTGIHITVGYCGVLGFGSDEYSLLSKIMWSFNAVAGPGIIPTVTPARSHLGGDPIVSLAAFDDLFYSYGPPGSALLNPNSDPRRFAGDGEDIDFFISPDFQIAWALG